MIAELHRRAVMEFGEGAEPMDYIRDWVANGQTLVELANDLTETVRLKVSRSMLYQYTTASEKGRKLMAEARAEGAGALVENAIAKLDDDTNLDKYTLAANRARGDIRLKTAAFWDRQTYGQEKQAQQVINIGTLHLTAHREREQQRLSPAETIEDAVVEALPAGDEG